MKEQTLLRRFRWPIVLLLWGGGELAGTAYHFNDSELAMIGLVIALFAAAVAVVLNTIDETSKDLE